MTDNSIESGHSAERAGVVGIFITEPGSTDRVNRILRDFAGHIKGRLGVPRICRNPALNVISLIFLGTSDELGSMAGRLGQLKGVEVKSLLSRTCIHELSTGRILS